MRRGERGSAAIEAAIGVPALLLFVALIIGAGRVAIAHQAVEAAATEAARSASIERTRTAAASSAEKAAVAALANHGLSCIRTRVDVDTSGFVVPAGTAASVSATVTCVVNLSDVAVPGLPGSIEIATTVRSPLDTYRGR